jgi:hypothetical protein
MDAVAAVIVVVVVLLFVAMRLVGNDDPFQTAAARLDLKLSRSVPELLPRLEGVIKGLPVHIDIAEGRHPGVRYRVFYPALGISLRLERETTITRTLGELGQQDTQVGARPFDQSFRVNTSRPDALREMMTPELRRTLVKLIDDYPTILIEDGGISYTSGTSEEPAETIIQTMIDMAAAAHQLVSRRPKPLEKPTTPPRQADEAAAAPQPKTARPKPTRSPTPPQSVPQPAARSTPERTTPPPPPPPASAQPPDTGLPDTFFDEVFGDNRLSFEADGQFDERFRGKTVTLSGPIKQAREIEEDATVTTGPATKAVVTVAQIENDLYGKTNIEAAVFFPAGTAAKLQRGEVITFRGTLEAVDPFMRNLFVTDARRLA